MNEDLVCFGLFSETCPQLRRKLSSISEAEFLEHAHSEIAMIVRYLKSGHLHYHLSGYDVRDPFLPNSPPLAGETRLVSDGRWLWPSTIGYFVERYHLRVPDKFLSHMESNQWSVSENSSKLEAVETETEHRQDESWERVSPQVPDAVDETGLRALFAECNTLDEVRVTAKSKRSELIRLLAIMLPQHDAEVFRLWSWLGETDVVPKFINQTRLTPDQICESTPFQLVTMVVDHLPLSWNEKEVLVLSGSAPDWQLQQLSWVAAMT